MLIKFLLTGFATFPTVRGQGNIKKDRARAPGDLSFQFPVSAKPRKTPFVSNLEAITVPANSYEDEADNYCEI